MWIVWCVLVCACSLYGNLTVAMHADPDLTSLIKKHAEKNDINIRIVTYDDPLPIMLSVQLGAPGVDLYVFTYNEVSPVALDDLYDRFFQPLDFGCETGVLPKNIVKKLHKSGPIYRIPLGVEMRSFIYDKSLDDVLDGPPSLSWLFDDKNLGCLPKRCIWVLGDMTDIVVLAYLYCKNYKGSVDEKTLLAAVRAIKPKIFGWSEDVLFTRSLLRQKGLKIWLAPADLLKNSCDMRLKSAPLTPCGMYIHWAGVSRHSRQKAEGVRLLKSLTKNGVTDQGLPLMHSEINWDVVNRVVEKILEQK